MSIHSPAPAPASAATSAPASPSAATPTPTARRRRPPAAAIGLIGGALGILAGIVEVTVGPSIRPWIGDKHDTTRLGLATIALSAIAFASAKVLTRGCRPTAPRRLLLGAGLLIPGLLCFTTVGRLWYLPGILITTAAVLTLVDVRGEVRAVAAAAEQHWTAILTATLGAFYLALGVTAQGLPGALGIVGGLATIGLVAARGHLPMPLTARLLLLAVVPFAVATWWSVITPLLATLITVMGTLALAAATPPTASSPRPSAEHPQPPRV